MASPQRFSRKQVLIGSAAVLLIALGIGGWWAYRLATRSDELTAASAWPEATPLVETHNETEASLAARLRAAGLRETPILNNTAIAGHLTRYRSDEVGAETLDRYAAELKALGAFSGDDEVRIPAAFWDVRTQEMSAGKVTEYGMVNSLAQPEMANYVRWMTNSFARFTKFKRAQAQGEQDTALDAALDTLHLTLDYLDRQLKPLPANAPSAQRKKRAEQAMRMWQNIVAGTTRTNPLTKKPMVAHPLSSRFTVMEMWRYASNDQSGDAQLWGVSGFAERFVGDAVNNINQVEHMSISAFLQLVLHEPRFVLNAEEEFELLSGHSHNTAMGRADMNLNRAIATEFAPYFADAPRVAVEQLRCYLKEKCPSRQ